MDNSKPDGIREAAKVTSSALGDSKQFLSTAEAARAGEDQT